MVQSTNHWEVSTDMDIRYLFNIFLAILLLKLSYDDLKERLVDDRLIILGCIFTLCYQAYIGQILDSILGALTGLIVAGAIFIFGNSVFTLAEAKDNTAENKINDVTFPLVPSLTLATFTHFLVPDGLSTLLLQAMSYIQNNELLSDLGIIISLAAIFWVSKNRTVEVCDSTEDIESTGSFGDGDITICILLGAVLGWVEFIAVFWVAQILQLIICSVRLGCKKFKLRRSALWKYLIRPFG
jgi:prepilin signal peptidase PulO-like enzyme (type II secretory pathway)